jgi:hypothetical protein
MDDIIKYIIIPYLNKFDDINNVTECIIGNKNNIKIKLYNSLPSFPNIYTIQELKICSKLSTNITDNDLTYLKGIHTLHLAWNTNITDAGLKNLKGIHTLRLYSNENITDKGLVYLKGIHTLDLRSSKYITDEGLIYIKGVRNLDIKDNDEITEAAIEYLDFGSEVNLTFHRRCNIYAIKENI